jgi:Ca-activated chloride channel family protein
MFRFLASLVLVLAAALPATAQEVGRTIIVFDASGSMWGQIGGKAKITIAQEVMGDLLQSLPDDLELGLTVYGHRRKGDCGDIESVVAPAAGTRAAIASAVNGISPRGKTPLSEAVIRAAEELKYTEEKATVILVSDGVETCDFDPCEVGRKLEAAGVDFTAHVIGFDVANPIDRAQLQCLAENTGGTFRTASDAAELTDALKVVSAPPPPPSPRHVRFVAVENTATGPQIRDDLVWRLTNTDSGEVVVADSAVSALDETLLPGNYLAEVLWTKTESNAELAVRVGQNTNTTFTLVLNYVLPEATISAPSSAPAGSLVTLDWTGPDETGDWIGASDPGDRDTRYITYEYTSKGAPLQVRMPPRPGTYELRYVLSGRGVVLARQAIDVTPVNATISLPASVVAGSTVPVDWTGPDYQSDYLSVAEPGADDDSYATYAYTRNGAPLDLAMPTEPGTYEVRYVMNQGHTVIGRTSVEVTGVSATLEAPATADAGSTVDVVWDGPDYDRDYISVARMDDGSNRYVNYTYTRHGSPAALLMPAEEGDYEIRYVLGADATVLARQTISVGAIGAALTAQDRAVVGEPVKVDWQGPGYDRDYVAVAEIGAKPGKYIGYAYTRNGNPAVVDMPLFPGQYELRYIQHQDTKILATREIEVVAAEITLSAPAVAKAGSDVAVEWTGPGWQRDYIAIALTSDKDTKYYGYGYTRNGKTLDIRMPATPGAYELRYIMNGGPDRKMAAIPITVEAVSASLSAPASGPAGGSVSVAWEGPGYDRDYVAIFPVGSKKYAAYAYVRGGGPTEIRLPDQKGAYEIRYVMREGATELASVPFTVE